MARNPMTPRGFNRLRDEHHKLLYETRPAVVQGVHDAAMEGDRSENAEYIYGKKRLREIDKRLAYLTKILKDVEVIDPQTVRAEDVSFGATVRVVDESGKARVWTLVGEGEADLNEGTISWKAPVAQALMGKKCGDWVRVLTPEGEREWELLAISYGSRAVLD